MKVADERNIHAHHVKPFANVRHGAFAASIGIDGDAHEFRTGAGKFRGLLSSYSITSAVSVFVIDCTTIGASPPTRTPPISTAIERRRGAADVGISTGIHQITRMWAKSRRPSNRRHSAGF